MGRGSGTHPGRHQLAAKSSQRNERPIRRHLEGFHETLYGPMRTDVWSDWSFPLTGNKSTAGQPILFQLQSDCLDSLVEGDKKRLTAPSFRCVQSEIIDLCVFVLYFKQSHRQGKCRATTWLAKNGIKIKVESIVYFESTAQPSPFIKHKRMSLPKMSTLSVQLCIKN